MKPDLRSCGASDGKEYVCGIIHEYSSSLISVSKEPEMDKTTEHSITRRVFYLYERAVKKFKADVGLWVEYI